MPSPLAKGNSFTLNRNLFMWTMEHHAPYVRKAHEGLLKAYKRHWPHLDWEEELRLARQDISRAEAWGYLHCDRERIPFHHKGISLDVAASSAGWHLLYPDYLLCAYPTLPAGRAKRLDVASGVSANPAHNYPSQYWHLPPQVYQWFEYRYGPRKPEIIQGNRYMRYLDERKRYISYFCRKYKLKPSRFELFSPLTRTEDFVDIA